jgi:hypothetical protein
MIDLFAGAGGLSFSNERRKAIFTLRAMSLFCSLKKSSAGLLKKD